MSIEDETPSRLEPPLGMADDDDPEIARVASVLAARLLGEPLEATRIGRFLVIDRIGAGGMGVVYSAFDPRLDRRVALKLLPARGSEQQEARLLTEAKALAKLSHPNVVAVFEVGEHGGGVFLAMEYVQGRTLRQCSDERVRTWEGVLLLWTQAGRGLAAAHAAGVVHRDFEPDNVLVGDDGRVRVVDFGLARAAVEHAREPLPLDAAETTCTPPPFPLEVAYTPISAFHSSFFNTSDGLDRRARMTV